MSRFHSKTYHPPVWHARYIITNNGNPFVNMLVIDFCRKFKFAQHKSLMYNGPTNGLAEAFNKTICNLLRKVVAKSKRNWHARLGELFGLIEQRIRRQLIWLLLLWCMGLKRYCLWNFKFLHFVLQYGKAWPKIKSQASLDWAWGPWWKRLWAQQKLEWYQARLSRGL